LCGFVGEIGVGLVVGVEGRVLDAVAVDFTDVEVFFHFGDVAGRDAVGCAPDSGWGCGMLFFLQMSLVRDREVFDSWVLRF
jgi:hypothetical protein